MNLFNGHQKKLPDPVVDEFNAARVRGALAPKKEALFPELLELHAGVGDRQVLLRSEFRRARLRTAHGKLKRFARSLLRLPTNQFGGFLPQHQHRLLLLLTRRIDVLDHVGVSQIDEAKPFSAAKPPCQLDDGLRSKRDVDSLHTLHRNLEDHLAWVVLHEVEKTLVDLPPLAATPSFRAVHKCAKGKHPRR